MLLRVVAAGQATMALLLLLLHADGVASVSLDASRAVVDRLRGEDDDLRMDGGIDRLQRLLSDAHQTASFDACRYHRDVMGKGLESKATITLGTKTLQQAVPACGSIVEPVHSALAFAVYGVQILIGAIGGSMSDGDVEMHDATSRLGYHGNLGNTERGAYLRRTGRLYQEGCALCDHPKIGTTEWIDRVRNRHGYTHSQAWAAAASGDFRAWLGLGVAGQAALVGQFQAVHHTQRRALAQGMNPNIP
jgi:hypothetical protein